MKPTAEELSIAMDAAERMHQAGVDPHHIAQSLRYMYQRNRDLEQVLEHVELFLRFGMPAEEHAKLRRLVDEIRLKERREGGGSEDGVGL